MKPNLESEMTKISHKMPTESAPRPPPPPGKPQPPLQIRILTHNIRYATTSPFPGEEPWQIRCPRLCAELTYSSQHPPSTFICLQEVLHSQLLDIQHALTAANPDPSAPEGPAQWTHIGVGRDDGLEAGEYSPIFYRPAVWHLQRWRTVWLSETPETPSRGWDAASVRIVTVGEFLHRDTGVMVVVMSTHLDDQGSVSRAESARLLLGLVGGYGGAVPVFLGGDLNSEPRGEAYKILTGDASELLDSTKLVSSSCTYGHRFTFTSFGEDGLVPTLIDFVFCNGYKGLRVDSHAVLENKFDDGVYNSDHRAVVVDFTVL